MVSVMRLPAFIATLGTMDDYQRPGFDCDKYGNRDLSAGFGAGRLIQRYFLNLKGAGLPQAGIPTGFILLIILAILMAILLNKARPGRYILSLGSNKEATRLSVVNVVKWETLAYVISGLFAGLAGVSYAAVYSTLMPGTGNGFELDAIAGVVESAEHPWQVAWVPYRGL